MLRAEDIAGLRWKLVTRVSQPGQARGPSLQRQEEQTKDMVEKYDGELIDSIQTEESATTLDRDSIDEIVSDAEAGNYDVLGLPTLDRLTRADPWDAIDLMRTLYENDVIICTAYYGPYDWDDLQDFRRLANDIAFSREIVVKIKNGQKRGFSTRLKNRKWPFNKTPPTGFEIDDDLKLYLKDGIEKIAPAVFDIYTEGKSEADTKDEVNKEVLPEGDFEELTEAQISSILKNRMFRGELRYDGKVYAEVDEFELISENDFQQAVETRQQNSPTYSSEDSVSEPLDSLDHVEKHAKRFGAHHTFLNILTRFVPHCDECDAAMDWDGTSTGQALGVNVPRFECEECDNKRNIPSKEELKAMHQVLPYRCPYCVGTEEFTIRPIKQAGAKFDYIHECEVCGHTWGSNMSCNKLKRFLDHPELGFSLNDETPNSYEPPEDDSQKGLDEFEDGMDD